MRSSILRISLTLFFALLAFSCSHEIPDPASPVIIDDDVPPTPTNLSAAVGDMMVELTWDVDGDTSSLTYRIYMARIDTSGFYYSLAGESGETAHIVSNLQNGVAFAFKVSAVNADDFEGYKSDSITVTPNHFGLMINNGLEFTSSRDVTLTMFAPAATRFMTISEDSSFAGAQWESFSPSRSFRLSAGDGSKTVYVGFRDSADRMTAGYISDSINLDTGAGIDSVRFSPAGAPFSPGAVVHFSLYAGETGGEASITIGAEIVIIELSDDGLNGDAAADDGIYEVDYSLGSNLDFEGQTVYGDFIDRAGNNAPRTAADYLMSVRRPPDAVNIYSLTVPEGYFNRLRLAWSSSGAPDFAEYRVYRDTISGIDSSDFLAETLTSRSSTTFTDTDLLENTGYYYRVYVVDNTGLMTGSQEVSGTTGVDEPPEPVELYTPVATPGTYDRLELSWSSSEDNDFLRYELYRSDDSAVDSLDLLVFSSGSQTSFTDTGLRPDSLYYYAVLTCDFGGNKAWSNSASGRTNADEPPEAVTLYPVIVLPDHYQEISLNWSESADDDFASYRLYRWQEDIGRNDSTMIALISEVGTTSFDDNPPFNVAEDTVNFWYILHLYDDGGNSAPSDSIRVHLIDGVPPTVNGSVEPSENSLYVSWTASDIPDFGSYRLLRDTDGDPAGALTVFITADQTEISFDDGTAVQGQVYFYWLDIYDRRNNTSRSSLGSGSW